MKKYILLLALLPLFIASCEDDPEIYKGGATGEYTSNVDWTDAANKVVDALINNSYGATANEPEYKFFLGNVKWRLPATFESGVPPTEKDYGFGYWMQPHAMDIVIDAYVRTGDAKYKTIFSEWLKGIKYWNARNHWGNNHGDTGLWNEFYDDMLWCALTTLRMYDITGEQEFMDATMIQWNFIKTARNIYESNSGGAGTGVDGMAWKWGAPYSRMSCSNGPGCLFAMKLYKIAKKEGREKDAAEYLDFAQKVYAWMSNYLCDVSTGQVFDNLSIANDKGEIIPSSQWNPDKVALSYNQGTFMGSAIELYLATGEEDYLRHAVAFASYQVNKKTDSNYLVFSGEGSNGDNLLFRGVFMRYFLDIIKLPTNSVYSEKSKKKFINSLRSNSDILWSRGRPATQYMFEYSWSSIPQIGNRGDENALEISTNANVSASTAIQIRARYEDWAAGKESEQDAY